MKIGALMMVGMMVVSTAALAAKPRPIAVEDRGMDGEMRIYSVRCPDDRRLGMEHHFNANKVCFVPLGGQHLCLPGGNLDRAAKEACRLSKPRQSNGRR
jgi:hypothetical protein